MKNVDKFHLF